MAQKLVKYHPPSWASALKHIPENTVKLAMTPTPIQGWKPPGTPEDFKVYIKRDDLTGSVLTGNKVRKLEFILAEAIQRSCKHMITTGSIRSNHCRTTSVACAELGLQSHLFIRSHAKDISEVEYDGNMLINKLVGSQMYLVPWFAKYDTEVKPRMERLAQKIEKETGEKSMLVPIGGSDIIGLWGYMQCFEEIRQQGVEFDDLVCVCGSGGTTSGLAIANYLCGSPYRVHGIKITGAYDIHQMISDKMDQLGITGVNGSDTICLYEDYIGLGYAVSQPHELDYIAQTAEQTGIILDSTYTGKAAYGLTDLMQKRPEVFKGRRILFLHSGGLTSIHSTSQANALLDYSTKSTISMSPPIN